MTKTRKIRHYCIRTIGSSERFEFRIFGIRICFGSRVSCFEITKINKPENPLIFKRIENSSIDLDDLISFWFVRFQYQKIELARMGQMPGGNFGIGPVAPE